MLLPREQCICRPAMWRGSAAVPLTQTAGRRSAKGKQEDRIRPIPMAIEELPFPWDLTSVLSRQTFSDGTHEYLPRPRPRPFPADPPAAASPLALLLQQRTAAAGRQRSLFPYLTRPTHTTPSTASPPVLIPTPAPCARRFLLELGGFALVGFVSADIAQEVRPEIAQEPRPRAAPRPLAGATAGGWARGGSGQGAACPHRSLAPAVPLGCAPPRGHWARGARRAAARAAAGALGDARQHGTHMAAPLLRLLRPGRPGRFPPPPPLVLSGHAASLTPY